MDKAASSKRARAIAFLAVAFAVVGFDQASKAWARVALADGPLPFIPHVMELRHVQNTGAAFSLGEGQGWLFVIIAAVMSLALFFWVVREDMGWPLSLALASVAGGGIGNMIDRIAMGSVTDFLSTTFIDFPIFNVADIFVTCGVALSLLIVLTTDEKES